MKKGSKNKQASRGAVPGIFFRRVNPSTVLVLITLIVLINLMIPFFPEVTIRDGETNKRLMVFTISPEASFSIQYIHSIHLTPVTEQYGMTKDLQLILQSVQFDTYSVGMPSDLEPGETFKEKNGRFVIEGINRKLPFFDLRIGQEIANHIVIIKGKEFPLREINPPGTWVRFQIEKESLFNALKGGYLFGQ